MSDYYVTTAANHPGGSGYWKIVATSEREARALAFRHCPEGKWSFMYRKVEEIHLLDQKCHGTIGEFGELERENAKLRAERDELREVLGSGQAFKVHDTDSC